MIGAFSEIAETQNMKFSDSPLGKQLSEIDDLPEITEMPAEEIERGEPLEIDDTSLDLYVDEIPEELCDDNGEQYKNDDGKLIPNKAFTLNDVTYKTDDHDNIYFEDGRLPNTTYELKGNVYTTDENGRIISCEGKPQSANNEPRDLNAQREAGGDDRREGDQGGHIVGRDIGGDNGEGNLVAMDSRINQSDYKRMEDDIKEAMEAGKDVSYKVDLSYSGDSERPDKITVTVTIDGKDTVYEFDNNIDGSLRDEVPENGMEAVQEILDDKHGEISSIKKEYDENGNLVNTTVCITYKDENGVNQRRSYTIENNQGGN